MNAAYPGLLQPPRTPDTVTALMRARPARRPTSLTTVFHAAEPTLGRAKGFV